MSNNQNATVDVAVCADIAILPGLHVTLQSALQHIAPTHTLNIHLLHDGLTPDDIDLLNHTLTQTGRGYSLQPVPFSPAVFGRFRSLGGWMTYARIVVPQVVARDRVIYLDSDLIIYADLSKLYECPLNGFAIGAVSWFSMARSNDSAFMAAANVLSEAPYFNAGVLLIDVPAWHAANLTARSLAVGERHGRNLPSADQTILNSLLGANGFQQIPRRFNTPVTPGRRMLPASEIRDRVIHLQGRPKPWDPLGRYLHGQARHFFEQFQSTAYYEKWCASGDRRADTEPSRGICVPT